MLQGGLQRTVLSCFCSFYWHLPRPTKVDLEFRGEVQRQSCKAQVDPMSVLAVLIALLVCAPHLI
jgi:hypothetical protein